MLETSTPTPSPQPAPRFNAWTEVAGAGIAVIEAAWVTLLFQAFNEGAAATSTGFVFPYFTLVFYSAWQLVRLFQGVRLGQGPARMLLFASFVFFAWLGTRLLLPDGSGAEFNPLTTSLRGLGEVTRLIPTWLWLDAAVLWLFARGMGVGREGVGLFAVQRHFKLGIAMFVLYSFLALASERELPGLGVFVVFLTATLLAMAAARVSVLGRLRGGRRSPFSGRWFWNLSASVAATVAAGLSIAMLATGRLALFYRNLLAVAILAIVTITLAPFLFVVGLFADTPVESLPAPPPSPELPPWEDGGDVLPIFGAPGEAEEALVPADLRIFYIIGLAAAAVLLFFVFRRVQAAARARLEDDSIESLFAPGDLFKELRELFAARRKRLADALTGPDRLGRAQQIQAAARIRQIYTELVRLAGNFGLPRDPAQTPLEFAAVLEGEWPAAGADIDAITLAYLKIRYGGYPERAEEVRAVEESWRTIRTAGLARVQAYEQQQKNAERDRAHKQRAQKQRGRKERLA